MQDYGVDQRPLCPASCDEAAATATTASTAATAATAATVATAATATTPEIVIHAPPSAADSDSDNDLKSQPHSAIFSIDSSSSGSGSGSGSGSSSGSGDKKEQLEPGPTQVSDVEKATEAEMKVFKKIPWWSRYSGYNKLRELHPSRTRRASLYLSAAVVTSVLVVLIVFYRSGRLGGHYGRKLVSVRIPQGTYIGELLVKSETTPRPVDAFRGIPYAQSTEGPNRFRPPQPLLIYRQSADVIHDAVSYGHSCVQTTAADQSEDCLNLDLFRPQLDFGQTYPQKLPVVIYVHGGGFNGGHGRERNMASFVSWSDTPIIGIVFNYRLGALGFLASKVAQRKDVLNLGLKDQQMLLAWVQDNVASFGGDPDNVTLMGLSAGAHSIGHHLISYSPAHKVAAGKVPFHKAIIESGGATARATLAANHSLHDLQFKQFLVQCGINGTAADDDDIFDRLRSLPLSTIRSASTTVWEHWRDTLKWAFQPVIDGPGGAVPTAPLLAYEQGGVLDIPILTGFDTNEGAVFVPSGQNSPDALRKLMKNIIPDLTPADLKEMETLYPDTTTAEGLRLYVVGRANRFGKQFWRLDDAYSHYGYICPVIQTAHFFSTTKTSPVYLYHFAARSSGHGASEHGDERYVAGYDWAQIHRYPGLLRTADVMHRYWVRFAATGDPNSNAIVKSTPTWPRFESPFPKHQSDTKTNTGAGAGRMALFADGNDERMEWRGKGDPGVPVQMVELPQRERDECRFWFKHTLLSEGLGHHPSSSPHSSSAHRNTTAATTTTTTT